MSLEDFLKRSTLLPAPAKGTQGKETEWLSFCDLELRSGQLLIVDASLVPSETDGLLVELPTGKYAVEVKVISYGTDNRVSRLRLLNKAVEGVLGIGIGAAWTDTAQVGICDYEVFAEAWGKDHIAANSLIRESLEKDSEYGIVELDREAGAIMPFVSSGFGDGEFPVYEVRSPLTRAGAEIEFVGRDRPYPW